jgi:hypothetical protein
MGSPMLRPARLWLARLLAQIGQDHQPAHRMADQIDFRVGAIAGMVVVPLQLGARDHFVDELRQILCRSLQRLAPVVGKREHRHRLVLLIRQIMAQFLDQLAIADFKELAAAHQRRLGGFVAHVVWMQTGALIVLRQDQIVSGGRG